jgi:hypothetical protein
MTLYAPNTCLFNTRAPSRSHNLHIEQGIVDPDPRGELAARFSLLLTKVGRDSNNVHINYCTTFLRGLGVDSRDRSGGLLDGSIHFSHWMPLNMEILAHKPFVYRGYGIMCKPIKKLLFIPIRLHDNENWWDEKGGIPIHESKDTLLPAKWGGEAITGC